MVRKNHHAESTDTTANLVRPSAPPDACAYGTEKTMHWLLSIHCQKSAQFFYPLMLCPNKRPHIMQNWRMRIFPVFGTTSSEKAVFGWVTVRDRKNSCYAAPRRIVPGPHWGNAVHVENSAGFSEIVFSFSEQPCPKKSKPNVLNM